MPPERNGADKMIYIIRHGKTELNKANVLQGRSDHPLNGEGILQAKAAAERARKAEETASQKAGAAKAALDEKRQAFMRAASAAGLRQEAGLRPLNTPRQPKSRKRRNRRMKPMLRIRRTKAR